MYGQKKPRICLNNVTFTYWTWTDVTESDAFLMQS